MTTTSSSNGSSDGDQSQARDQSQDRNDDQDRGHQGQDPDTRPQTSPFRLARELLRYRPRLFAVCFVSWTAIHSFPLGFGLLIATIFDRLAGDEASISSAWTWVVVFGVLVVTRNAVIWIGDHWWISYWNDQALQLRRNLLRWLLEAEGSRILRSSPGEAVSTFRDDVEDLLEYMENWVDLGGFVLFGVGSVTIMATVDAQLTALLMVPLLLVVFVSQALGPQIRNRRRAMRIATEDVTGLIGETFGAVQSVKLSSAEQPMLEELRRRNEVRRRAALKDTLLTETLFSININMSTLTIATVLLVSATRLSDGTLSIGGLVLYLTYLPRLTFYLSFLGRVIAQHRRTGVAYERMRALAVDAPDSELLDTTRVPLEGEIGELPPVIRLERDRLGRLEAKNLSFTYPTSRSGRGSTENTITREPAGISDVGFALEQGSFTVLAGRVGSGKTTILRALLGLVPADGEVSWNGRAIQDRASFLVPPRSAYTPQIPKLFSDSLAYNIALREARTSDSVHAAARLAVMDADLERLAGGLHTMVGARGVKLSGGQVQRSAVARMFATEADLLVFDDLSSALDLHTEAELWNRLFEHREATCLVVSHRPAALQRADQILVVDGGRIVDRGTLAELLDRSPVMVELWEASGYGNRSGPSTD